MRRIVRYIAPAALCSGILFAEAGREVPVPPQAVPHPVMLEPIESTIFADSVPNVIVDSAASLAPFYEQLAMLQTADSEQDTIVLPIVHLGDSHIQAGFLTGRVMREFHRDFGNAGRGLITPLRLAKTNEPSDYAIRSGHPWESARLTQSARALPVGIGGMAIGTKQRDFTLSISALDRYNPDAYRFNRVHVFKHPAAPPLQAEGVPVDTAETSHIQTITLTDPCSELALSGRGDSAIYHGFSLENGSNGILYHAAGINGAQFAHWPRVDGLGARVAALKPTLIILSMGTNEALATTGFSAERLDAQIDALVNLLREANPDAVFLLTTPPDSYRRRRVNRRTSYLANPRVGEVAAVIRDYATRNNLACWDLYTISGGEGSREAWQKAGLFGRDRLHFTAEGYEAQAGYLYHALIQGFNDYVRDHYGEPAPAAEL